jgi:TetR/AcrR family acrAB operon transcriptional repressor
MRRTKEDSKITRQRIIAAARSVFARKGVSGTTLEQIAGKARVTRGAIYWHFSNKTELFFAMREQVALPLIDCADIALGPGSRTGVAADPLAHIERYLGEVIGVIANDKTTRETFRIMLFRCEYVGEFERELETQIRRTGELVTKLARGYRKAELAGTLREGLAPRTAALATCVFLVGMIRLCVLDRRNIMPRRTARELIALHMAGHRRAGSGRRRSAHKGGPR